MVVPPAIWSLNRPYDSDMSSPSVWGDIMSLTFQGTALRVVHERGTRSTVDDQRGDRDKCQPFRGDRTIPHDGIIAGKRRCYRLEEWPNGRLAHPGNRFSGGAPRDHSQSEGITPASLGEQSCQLPRVAFRRLVDTLVTSVERWLVQRQLCDGEATLRGLKCENPA
jgi:hypothetical protein